MLSKQKQVVDEIHILHQAHGSCIMPDSCSHENQIAAHHSSLAWWCIQCPLWCSWLAPLTYSFGALPKLGEMAGLSHIQEESECVFFVFFLVLVPRPTQLSFQTILFGFLPQSEGWIQRQTGELCSPGTGSSVVVGTMFTLYYSWVRRSPGGLAEYINFENLN